MKLAQASIIEAIYTLLTDKVQAGNTVYPYELSYVQRVLNDGGTLELSTCFTDVSELSSTIPVYTSESPDFSADAYIYIYPISQQETGPQDEFIYDCSVSIKCAIANDQGVVSVRDVNKLGNTVAEIMQPTTFDTITVTGFNVITQQIQSVNYVEPLLNGSRYEFSVTMDWLVRVASV